MTLTAAYAVPGFLVATVVIICLCNPLGKGTDVAQRGYTLTVKKTGSKKYGLICKWCFVLLLCPLYFVTIVMSFYIFGGNVGMDIIDDACALVDTDCVHLFSFGAENLNHAACADAANCDVYAKQGSQPSDFNLGKSLAPTVTSIVYTCTDPTPTGCNTANASNGIGFTPACGDNCTEWAAVFDDDVTESFKLITCTCQVENAAPCGAWDCVIAEYPYFYPNVLFAVLVGLLYIIPICLVMGVNTKFQCQKKLLTCADPEVYVFTSGGGFETTGADLSTGGHSEAVADKDKDLGVKGRSFSRFDVATYVFGTLFLCVLGYCMWVAAGDIGMIVFGASIGLVFLGFLAYFCVFKKEQGIRTSKRIKDRLKN